MAVAFLATATGGGSGKSGRFESAIQLAIASGSFARWDLDCVKLRAFAASMRGLQVYRNTAPVRDQLHE